MSKQNHILPAFGSFLDIYRVRVASTTYTLSMGESHFSVLLQHVKQIEDGNGGVRTQAFLNACREILPVVGENGEHVTSTNLFILHRMCSRATD